MARAMTSKEAEEKPYVLHIASQYPSDVDRFDGDHIQKYIDTLGDEYVHVVVHAQKDISQKKTNYKRSISNEGNASIHICYYRPWIWILNTLAHCRALHAVSKPLISSRRPILVHVHGIFPGGFYALYLKWCLGVRYIVTEHSSFFIKKGRGLRHWFKERTAKYLLNHTETILPVSQTLERSIRDIGVNSSIICIPNPIPDRFFEVAKSTNSKQTFDLIHVSNGIDEVKNISGILRAFKQAILVSPNLRLSLVLSANFLWIQRAIVDQRLGEFVTIFKEFNNVEMPSILAQHDALVHFSNFETFGIVIAEAWAVGLPVITADFGGVANYMSEMLGEKLTVGDEAGLCDAMINLSDSESFDPEVIRAFASERFSKEVVGRSVAQVYKSVIG